MTDILVIGGGVFGLSVAYAAVKAGLDVQVVDAEHPGAGASGGIVGALTAHAPTRWRPMMAFQFQALLDLPGRIAEIEAATGLSAGYARTGRWTPLGTEKARARAEADVDAAPTTWGDRAATAIIEDLPPEAQPWITPKAARFGVQTDTISARIDPRAYVAALAAAVGPDRITQRKVLRVEPGFARTATGGLPARHIVLAAGWQGWDLVAAFDPALAGRGVKGQAALMRVAEAPAKVIYREGIYVIPHATGLVAVGSTSENHFDTSDVDEKLDHLIAQARHLSPALEGAEVVERWSGLRPKPPHREPVIGPIPGAPRVWIAGGGFKIGFGIAHAAGDALVAMIQGQETANPVPETFLPGAGKAG
ncbi:MAG: FAD-binding oxidoreductase [Pseudomonadota bacterium]